MAFHYPIYVYAERDSGFSPTAQFGARDGFDAGVFVGTSRKNSHLFGALSVRRRTEDDGSVLFTLFLDGKPIKAGTLRGKEFVLNAND